MKTRMEAQKQVVPIRTPESAYRGDVVRVLGSDGRAHPPTDPRLEPDRVLAIYRAMARARLVDAQLEKLQRQGRIGFHVGALGEEAAVVASTAALAPEDWVFPCYREAAALLYRGFPLQRYVDNMFGNQDDPVEGRQMPDHITSRELRYGSVSSPIGTQITHAVGLAHGIRLRKKQEVAAVFFGDGATSSNDFHAGMNFAGVWKAPVLFLLRNNRWAISLPSEKQTACKVLADKAAGYGIPAIRCDGNDALAVYSAVRQARDRALRGEGPTLVELLTYRKGSHSTSESSR
jgi:pyruvate dehydrogenase E1 component alpha subunit